MGGGGDGDLGCVIVRLGEEAEEGHPHPVRLGKWNDLKVTVIADTVSNECRAIPGVIKLREMVKDHHVPVE